jgi:hypothetical protein
MMGVMGVVMAIMIGLRAVDTMAMVMVTLSVIRVIMGMIMGMIWVLRLLS